MEKEAGRLAMVEGCFDLADLSARRKALRRGDERRWSLSPDKKLGLEDGSRNKESPDMRGCGIGNLREASKAWDQSPQI